MLSTLLLLVVAQTPPPPITVPGGALVVHLVDPDGELVLEDFVIHATPQRPPSADGRRSLGSLTIDRRDGTATFDSLRPGRYIVEALHRTGDAAEPTEVEVRARERVSCELRLATPPPSRCLYVVVPDPERVEGLEIIARAASGEAFPLALDKDATNRYVARGVPPGRYTVSVVDPRFRATSIEDVLPGEVAQLALTGAASLTLRFRAVPGGASLQPRALHLTLASWTLPRWPAGEDTSLVVLEDLTPGELLAVAHFAERAPVLIHVDDLRHGERRELEVDVPIGHTLTGRVVDAVGGPVAGVAVRTGTCLDDATVVTNLPSMWLEPGFPDEIDQPDYWFSDVRATRRVAQTDAEGRYTIPGLAPGRHIVCAYGTPFTRKQVKTLIDAEHESHTAPDIALVGSATANVDVRLPADLDEKELEFAFRFGSNGWLKPIDPESLPVLDAHGQVVLRGLPEVACTLVLSRRAPGPPGSEEHAPLARVTFVPKRGSPTSVVLDARPQ